MKTALIGDSYCADIGKESWPWYFCNITGSTIINVGNCGYSFWNSVHTGHPNGYDISRYDKISKDNTSKGLFNIVDKADFIIFCVSGHERLPNTRNLPLQPHNNFEGYIDTLETLVGSRKTAKLIHNSTINYYEHLYNDDWHQTAQRGTIQEVDELMLKKNKKCFWMESFSQSFCNAKIDSGPILNVPLSFFSLRDKVFKEHGPDTRLNHMNINDNQLIGSLISDVWNKLNNNTLRRPFIPIVP